MKKNIKIFLPIILSIILVLIISLFYCSNNDSNEKEENISSLEITSESTSSLKLNSFYVDIKGSVEKPGVYEFNENDRVIDAINKSGGLKSYANTSNINLSQKLSSEMVIYVYSNKEIKNGNNYLDCSTKCENKTIEVNNCIDETRSTTNLININEASKDTLTTITGIGESKAESIIQYREENGLFESIEDIKNVSGIGEALFEKIKDKITT